MRENNLDQTALPIDDYLVQINAALVKNNSLVLTAPPGSGKTTRVPAFVLKNIGPQQKIIVLVPRRIAAISTAMRICEENNWAIGNEVGYQVRFENKTSAKTQLIFMTEGVFLKKINDPKIWNNLFLVVFDEFHERSSNIDLALGICFEKQILENKIKLLVMSATLDTHKIKNYLSGCEVINVNNKPYPLEIIKSKKSQRLMIDYIFTEQLSEILVTALNSCKRDVLVFLPGLSEIRYVEKMLAQKFKNLSIAILHGSIGLDEQRKILLPATTRRIILATNIAESSITISSVDCVVDSGLVKKSTPELKIGFKRLELCRISLFSAKQRAGRAARTSAGICYQMWHELDERSMPEQILPEIMSSDLKEEVLILSALDITNPAAFSWLDKPKNDFTKAITELKKWELITSNGSITELGLKVQSCPLDIERGVLFSQLLHKGFHGPACYLMAFLETTNFERINEAINLDQLYLNDLGKKNLAQLKNINFNYNINPAGDFKTALIEIYFKYFPHKIAKHKEKNFAISSLGRGVELMGHLVSTNTDYFLLLSGREYTSALTKCDFAIGFTSSQFESLTSENISTEIEVTYDTEKRKLYKIEKKMMGFFVISESAKSYINESSNTELFKSFLNNQFELILFQHNDYKNYVTKVNFLKNKMTFLNYVEADFEYLINISINICASIIETVNSVDEFFNMNLYDIILFSTPENIRINLQLLKNQFSLPSGKLIDIDYASAQAPKISARIQELFGQIKNPSVLSGKIPMTVELLAPNYRPTQVTSQLEQFWQVSYFEIKKELKPRYPKHAWPDDPLNYKPIEKK